ncbi:hypothetical protein BASA60_010803 [Batrachochytrium salamandrivorans]|nr:hypothetical protein BASA60_010803 [Batrachochytrium salamandrivorans]
MAEETADSGGHVATGEFAAPLSNVEQFVRGLGTFVSAKLDEIPAENGARLHVIRLVGLAFLSAALQLMSIRVERNSANEQAAANDQLPPVMPHELVKDGWGLLGLRFPALFEFAGGLATVFPGTSTVEADFFRLRREKDIFRQSLSDFGLECVLHAQQHKGLLKITTKN